MTHLKGIPEEGSYPSEEQDPGGGHLQAPSVPRLLQTISTSNRFITVAWHEPELNTDHTVGYSVVYKQEGSLREHVQNVSAAPPARDWTNTRPRSAT